MGVLSALPLVNLGNACCCLWVMSGGAVAAYLLQQEQATPITPGDGAFVGFLAGLFGTLVTMIVSVPVSLLVAPFQRQLLEQMNRNGQMPPGLEDFATSMAAGVLGMIIFGMIFLVAAAIFSTLGGLLGALIFKKSSSLQL